MSIYEREIPKSEVDALRYQITRARSWDQIFPTESGWEEAFQHFRSELVQMHRLKLISANDTTEFFLGRTGIETLSRNPILKDIVYERRDDLLFPPYTVEITCRIGNIVHSFTEQDTHMPVIDTMWGLRGKDKENVEYILQRSIEDFLVGKHGFYASAEAENLLLSQGKFPQRIGLCVWDSLFLQNVKDLREYDVRLFESHS